VVCFFSQAEDGIRDATVTGVQTCALPICDESLLLYPSGGKARRILLVGVGKSGEVTRSSIRRAAAVAAKRARVLGATQLAFAVEIGRASCRERVARWRGCRQVREVEVVHG